MEEFRKKPVIRVIDFETGHAPTEDCNGVIEVGYIDISARDLDLAGRPINWKIAREGYKSFVKISRPIEPDFQAVHHISDEDLEWGKTWLHALADLGHPPAPDREIVAFCAFGIEHEIALLGESAQAFPWICMHKVALRLWPDSPSHSNQCVRYYLKIGRLSPELYQPAHRALPDARVTAEQLLAALNGHEPFNEAQSLEHLIDVSSKPSLLPRCKVGEWRGADKRGTPWSKVDSGYLNWILGKDFDESTKFTARYHLEQREIDQRLEGEQRDLNRQLVQNGMADGATEINQDAQRDRNTMELPL